MCMYTLKKQKLKKKKFLKGTDLCIYNTTVKSVIKYYNLCNSLVFTYFPSVMVTLAIYSLNVYVNLMVSDNLMPTELLAFSKFHYAS